MNIMRELSALLVVVSCFTCSGADQEFYRHFSSFTATDTRPIEITSPSLVDTNNTGAKLKNLLANLGELKTGGELCGIRVGMTMEELVARWGKPPKIISRCQRRPLFRYTGVNVYFEPATNAVMAISAYNRPGLGQAIPVWPTVETWVHTFGRPTRGDDYTEGWLIYETTNMTLKVGCAQRRLNHISLSGAVKPAAPEN